MDNLKATSLITAEYELLNKKPHQLRVVAGIVQGRWRRTLYLPFH